MGKHEESRKITNEMIDMSEKGYTLEEIGKAFGMSKQAVSQRLLKRGYNTKERKSFYSKKLKKLGQERRLDVLINELQERKDKYQNLYGTYQVANKKLRRELDVANNKLRIASNCLEAFSKAACPEEIDCEQPTTEACLLCVVARAAQALNQMRAWDELQEKEISNDVLDDTIS